MPVTCQLGGRQLCCDCIVLGRLCSCLNLIAEILGDPYSKKSPLPSTGTSPCLTASTKDTSYRVLGQSRIHQRHTTYNNPTRIIAQ